VNEDTILISFTDFRKIWAGMTKEEKTRVQDKAKWERMSLWAVLNEWPKLTPERLQ